MEYTDCSRIYSKSIPLILTLFENEAPVLILCENLAQASKAPLFTINGFQVGNDSIKHFHKNIFRKVQTAAKHSVCSQELKKKLSCITFLMLCCFYSVKAVLKVPSHKRHKTEMTINLLKDFFNVAAKRSSFIRSYLTILLTFSGQ